MGHGAGRELYPEAHWAWSLIDGETFTTLVAPFQAKRLLIHRPTRGRTPTAVRCALLFLLRNMHAPTRNAGCQFFITTAKCDFLDGKHVVFGRVADGLLTLRKIENVPVGPNNRPKLAVKITGA